MTAVVPSVTTGCDTIGSTIRVIQPASLENIVTTRHHISPVQEETTTANHGDNSTIDNNSSSSQSSAPSTKTAGYRVQVFSDNNQRTAKGEARSKEKLLREAFPDYETYIVYTSPFWRLKVGDFKTIHEAEAAADAIRGHFASFAREIRVVRDRINVR